MEHENQEPVDRVEQSNQHEYEMLLERNQHQLRLLDERHKWRNRLVDTVAWPVSFTLAAIGVLFCFLVTDCSGSERTSCISRCHEPSSHTTQLLTGPDYQACVQACQVDHTWRPFK